MSAFKPKHQRLVLVVLALVALVGAGLLAAYALRNQASYFTCRNRCWRIRPHRDRPSASGAW